MSDVTTIYSVPHGTDIAPDLPPVNLPSTDQPPPPSRPTRITITPAPKKQAQLPQQNAPDDWSDVSAPVSSQTLQVKNSAPDDWSDVSSPGLVPPKEPDRQIGGGEALARGAADTASFGLAPMIAGLNEAGNQAEAENPALAAAAQEASPAGVAGPMPLIAPAIGAAKMLTDWASGKNDPTLSSLITGVKGDQKTIDAYERGRQSFLKNQQLSQEQHPVEFILGQLAGAAATPAGFGLGTPARLGGRVAAGALAGGVGGGLYSAGTGVSAEETPEQIAIDTGEGVVGGAITGGAFHGAFGPRPPRLAATPGQQAADTAATVLNRPIPKGVASDSRAIRSTTSAAASIPLVGARIRNALDATREAAGEAVNQSGVDEAIQANRQRIDALYNSVRGQIDPDQVMPMPRTAAALAQVRANRVAARQPNPDQGLEQFDNVARQGASFNGAHRARVDAREAGDALNPHPGYNAADYNRITRAMTADIRANVHAQGGTRALRAFEEAESRFGPISEANKFLSRIARQRGPGAGLDEIGFNPATGEFSLDKFVTAWNKINPQARPFVPEPAHARNIQAIFQMGQHIKSSMRERNTSHTSTPLIMWDLARDSLMTGAAVAGGLVSGVSVIGSAAAAAPLVVLMHWLASPARASSMAAWSRSYMALRQGTNAARLASFKIATRNLAHTLGLNAQQVLERVEGAIASEASPEDNSSDNK